jgi:hypothetical protein
VTQPGGDHLYLLLRKVDVGRCRAGQHVCDEGIGDLVRGRRRIPVERGPAVRGALSDEGQRFAVDRDAAVAQLILASLVSIDRLKSEEPVPSARLA